MKQVTFLSNAKVNIGLSVLNKRLDGYHNIQTIFQEIDLNDVITLSVCKGLNFSADMVGLPENDSNTCIMAYKILKNKFPKIGGISIKLRKSIPLGSGLGGGSSNAATVLRGLNIIYKMGLGNKDLEELALKIGADVPFFIRGGTQIGRGIGEKLTPTKIIDGHYLLVIPEIMINTKKAYGQIKNGLNLIKHKPNFAGSIKGVKDSPMFIQNDFEQVIIPAYPEIGRIKKQLSKLGARFASLSGSGSTVFGVFEKTADVQSAQLYFQSRYKTVISSPIQG